MGMWGMLLWVIECAECHGHGPVDLRGRWRPLQAAAGREAEAEIFFCQIWVCGVCYYGLLNAPNVMGIVPLTSEAAGGHCRPLQAARPRLRFFLSDMGMWGMLLWVIECAECHGHSPVDLRGHWRLLQATAGRCRPLQAARLRLRIFLSDMGIWGMLLWIIECAECHGPLQATRPRLGFFFRYGHMRYVIMGY